MFAPLGQVQKVTAEMGSAGMGASIYMVLGLIFCDYPRVLDAVRAVAAKFPDSVLIKVCSTAYQFPELVLGEILGLGMVTFGARGWRSVVRLLGEMLGSGMATSWVRAWRFSGPGLGDLFSASARRALWFVGLGDLLGLSFVGSGEAPKPHEAYGVDCT